MKRIYIITAVTTAVMILAALAAQKFITRNVVENIKVGMLYIGDASTAYTDNFIKAAEAVKHTYGDGVELVSKYNVAEGDEAQSLQEFADEGCALVFSTSYGYGETVKEFAEKHPEIQFCQATCSNANEDPVLDNYHTFMGEIYQGRYISGAAAGMKLKELIDSGEITVEEAKIGYVGAYPYAEVISGYTAFLLGARSIVPEAVMTVVYTNTWSSYSLEMEAAEKLIENGCVVISQHSDTLGPAVACENSDKTVYHVGYNHSMANVAPTTHITGCRINWEPYMTAAVKAVMSGKDIEKCVDGSIYGNDSSAGFDKGWVEMLKVNDAAAAPGTEEKIEELTKKFAKGKTDDVFKGPYVGVNPFDETDTYDLSEGYIENKKSSAPTFNYVLNDIITIMPFEQ